MGGHEVRLIDLSRRGLLVETESRLAIGAKATIRIATIEGIVYVRGLVVRSRVVGIGTSIVFHTALALEEDLALADALAREQAAQASRQESLAGEPAPAVMTADSGPEAGRGEDRDRTGADGGEARGAQALGVDARGAHAHRMDADAGDRKFEPVSLDGLNDDGEAVQYALFESHDFFAPSPGEPESLNLTVTLPHALEELEQMAAERGDDI